ncbi:hypothetical protein B0T16DRAFT_457088 [Cercophora newfieldiana]|uniref:Uncharacterized protein n=1 Tax=Cercophora newfieldiana TaxID=92897 RepID=A0AA40CUN5_9PEZI|nr:hypothetical protein B0T16DRAFT_457088 [Cercophora newfieldiana]
MARTRLIGNFSLFVIVEARLSHNIVPLFIHRFGKKALPPSISLSKYLSLLSTAAGFSDGRHLQSSEPRDFVYSLIGNADQLLTINYADSVENVYADFAEAIIRHVHIAHLAVLWSGPHRRSPRLPSWVPDWSASGYFPPWPVDMRNVPP